MDDLYDLKGVSILTWKQVFDTMALFISGSMPLSPTKVLQRNESTFWLKFPSSTSCQLYFETKGSLLFLFICPKILHSYLYMFDQYNKQCLLDSILQTLLQYPYLMKGIKNLIEGYLRKYPTPSNIEMIEESMLKLTYTHSTPFTNSRSQKQIFLPLKDLSNQLTLSKTQPTLNYDEKGRIQEAQTFDSIMVAQKHEKLLQDDVFGMAKLSQDRNRWVYVAQVKDEKPKSYFLKGEGQKVYQHDFGETYDEVRDAKIFVWDKTKRQIYRIETESSLIPACPSFCDSNGSAIIFHAYTKTQFVHGLLHCFNRPVGVYEVTVEIEEEPEDSEKQAEAQKQKLKRDKQVLKGLKKLISDKYRTNIFPRVSKCFNYLVYCSGQNKTHTHYLDLVIMKRENSGWKELHRLKDKLIGYYSTLKLYPSELNGRPICYFQTIHEGVEKIFKADLESGQVSTVSQSKFGESYSIASLHSSGALLGTVDTHNYNTFFYSEADKLSFVDPPHKENFCLEEFTDPVHSYYLQAKEEDILEEYKERAKKRPLVLIAHGGPHGSIHPTFTLMRYTLLKMGYSILMPNFSGSAGYGQEHLEGALGHIGEKDGKQIIALLEKLFKEKPYIDRESVHVYGGSYGGFMGGIMGSRFPQYFRSAVILNGVLSIPATLFFSDIPEWGTVETLGKENIHGLTEEDYVEMFRQSPISQPMKIPTLQFLGAKDRRVPYRQGLLFDAMTKRNGTEIKTFVYENSAHSLTDSVETVVDVIIKSLLFLEGRLGQEEENKAEK